MMNRIAFVAIMCLLGSCQAGLCNSGQAPGPAGCLDLVVEIVTAPCQLLATCLGMDGSRYGSLPPCQDKRPRTPVKKTRKPAVEDYSTKVVAPTPDQSERPPLTRRRPPAEPARPEKATWPLGRMPSPCLPQRLAPSMSAASAWDGQALWPNWAPSRLASGAPIGMEKSTA